MKQKPNYYSIIPASVRYDKNLTPNAKLLYAELSALIGMNGACKAPTCYFADLYEVSKTSIQTWLKSLEDNNYITRKVTYKEGSKEILCRYISLVEYPTPNILRDKNNITYSKNNITYSKGRFKKPTVEEVHEYCNERKNNICADAFMDFYSSKNWYIGRNKMKDWKAAVRNWERREKKNPVSKIDSQINEYLKGKELL